MTFIYYHLYSVWTEIFILICVCILLLFGVINSNKSVYGYPILVKPISLFTIQTFFLSLILELLKTPIYINSWNNFFINDSFAHYSKEFLLILFIFWIFSVLKYNLLEKINNFEYWILILLSIISTFLIIQANDFLSVYLAVEFQSLIFYILASFNRNSEFSTESGIKYFILGAFSSAFLLFGISMLYNLTGLTNFNDFQLFFLDFPSNEIGLEIFICLIFILTALLFKLSAAPFHVWTPDVYEGSPTSVTMFFSLIPKLAILGLISRFTILVFYDLMDSFYFLFSFSILMSSLIGTLGAFSQKKWKRFVTYSSISHVSFFLIGLLSNDFESISSIFFYWFSYMFMLISLFSFFLDFRVIKYPKNLQLRYLSSLKYLSIVNPILSISLTIILFSMIGIPPIAGFFSKFFILFFSVKNNIIGLTLIILFFSSISCFYYLRLIRFIYFDKNPELNIIVSPISKLNSLVLGISIFFLFFLFLDLDFWFNLSKLLAFSFFF